MREQYPFFRDADERTLAVIGEEAADSDLNGTYQKPYAILTDKRLYCKNEQGNFIADGKSVRLGSPGKPQRPWMLLISALLFFVWPAFMVWQVIASPLEIDFLLSSMYFWVPLLSGVAVIALFALNRAKLSALVGIAVGLLTFFVNLLSYVQHDPGYIFILLLPDYFYFVAAILCIVAFVRLKKQSAVPIFQLITSAGIFIFRENDYPKQEWEAFAAAIVLGAGVT